jgi:thiol-disulfide isomerase/thioredoxin
MNSKSLLILIVGVVVIGIGYAFWSSSNADTMMAKEADMNKEMNKDDTMPENEVEMVAEDNEVGGAMEKDKMADDSMMNKVGNYEVYAPEKLAMANDGDVVLFFKASWCPSCRALDSDIKASLEDIPAGVTILEVNYDDSTDLKKKYGVTSQHTLVQVDADGSMIKKWSGSGDLANVLSNIQ